MASYSIAILLGRLEVMEAAKNVDTDPKLEERKAESDDHTRTGREHASRRKAMEGRQSSWMQTEALNRENANGDHTGRPGSKTTEGRNVDRRPKTHLLF